MKNSYDNRVSARAEGQSQGLTAPARQESTILMSSRRPRRELPACYAFVQPGLESVAADEIVRDLGGEIKKSERGMVVFRVSAITPAILHLRTVEDVFLLAWGSDALSRRADDLSKIEKWTAR